VGEPDGTAAGAGRREGRGRRTGGPTILHVDMDAFFASVEVLDDPSLAGKPVIVGGNGSRGVVASCTYEARAYGVHSAMPSLRARQLCPHAVFVPGRYSRYAEVSAALHDILTSVTPLVEPIGLDEAFLDVRGAVTLFGAPAAIGALVRERVRASLRLDCAVGGGRTKMIAKLASRAAKPTAGRAGPAPGRGVVVIAPEDERAFLEPLAVERLWGVGPATAKRLHGLGVRTVGDLAALPDAVLVRSLGRAHGLHLLGLARGDDPDPVVADRRAKSVGHEETFAQDLYEHAALGAHLDRMAESVASVLRREGRAGRTVTVKMKFSDFGLATRSHTVSFGVDTGKAIAAIGRALLDGVELRAGVRLLGVSVSGLQPANAGEQLRLDLDAAVDNDPRGGATADDRQRHWQEVTAAVDAIRGRFGTAAVGTARMVGPRGIEVPARRDAPWGPSDPDALPV
jgi:DNA polymerase-4